MNRFITLALAIGLAFAGSAQDRSQGGISPDMMHQIVAKSAANQNKALSNAMATNSIDDLARNYRNNKITDTYFSIRFFSLVLTLAMFYSFILIGSACKDRLDIPYTEKIYNEETEEYEVQENPKYVTGNARKALIFISDNVNSKRLICLTNNWVNNIDCFLYFCKILIRRVSSKLCTCS